MSLSQIKYSIYEDKSNTMHYLSVPMEKELLYYATSAGRECLRSDYFNERQDINIYMINYVLSGEGMLHVDGKEFRLKAGDLTFYTFRSIQYFILKPMEWRLFIFM